MPCENYLWQYHCGKKSNKCAVQANICDRQLSFLGYPLFGVISTIVVMVPGFPIVYFIYGTPVLVVVMMLASM